MAEPTLDWIVELTLERCGDVEVRRRTRPAVEVLVAAADGEIDAVALQLDLDRAGRVRQVPEHECAGGVRGIRQRRHVVTFAGPEVDVGECQQSRVARQGSEELLAFHHADLAAQHLRDTARDVEVGGKVRPLGHDDSPVRSCPHHSGDEPEQSHGCGVGDEHLTRRRTDQLGDAIADAQRRFHPSGLGPSANQDSAPLVLGHLAQSRHRGFGETAHRVAVEIDGRLVVEEPIAEPREWVHRIQGGTRVTVEIGRKLEAHNRPRTSQRSGKNRSGIVVCR